MTVPVQAFVSPVIGGEHTNISADTLIKSGDGHLIGFHVNSTSSGTVVIYDNTSAAGTKIANTITPNTGWNALPAHFKTGLYFDVTGTIDLTVIWK